MRKLDNTKRQEALVHGAKRHAAIHIDTYGSELRDADGFLGDRASNSAFRSILDDWRKRVGEVGEDPLGNQPTAELTKKKLERILADDDIPSCQYQ